VADAARSPRVPLLPAAASTPFVSDRLLHDHPIDADHLEYAGGDHLMHPTASDRFGP
jgi:hypothetical protein